MTTDKGMNDSTPKQWPAIGSFSKTFNIIPSEEGLILIIAISIQETGGTG